MPCNWISPVEVNLIEDKLNKQLKIAPYASKYTTIAAELERWGGFEQACNQFQ